MIRKILTGCLALSLLFTSPGFACAAEPDSAEAFTDVEDIPADYEQSEDATDDGENPTAQDFDAVTEELMPEEISSDSADTDTDSTDTDTDTNSEIADTEDTDIAPEFSDSYSEEYTGTDALFSDGETETPSSVSYSYDEATSTLTISGTGSTGDFDAANHPAWYSYAGTASAIVVEEGISALGEAAFFGFSAVTSVFLPSTLTSVGKAAFGNCTKLAQISLPESVSCIGAFAFQYCPITTLTIPASLQGFTDQMLAGCYSLKELLVSSDNPLYTSIDGVIFNKGESATTLYLYPAGKSAELYVVPETVKEITAFAFYNADIQAVQLPTGLQKMGRACFYNSNIQTLSIPDSVTEIGTHLCSKSEALTSVTLGSGLTAISERAFEYCSSLSQVSFPDTLVSIGGYAFASTALKEVVLPSESVKAAATAFPADTVITVRTPVEPTQSAKPTPSVEPTQSAEPTPSAKPTQPAKPTPSAEPADPAAEISKTASRLPVYVTYDYSASQTAVNLVNAQRAAQGLSPLTADARLLEASMVRAAELSVLYSHTRPIGLAGTTASIYAQAESITAGQSTASDAVSAWMSGEGKANILNPDYTTIGIGTITADGVTYWVQLLGSGEAVAADFSNYTSSSRITEVLYTRQNGKAPFQLYTSGSVRLGLKEQSEVEVFINNGFSHIQILPKYLRFSSSAADVCHVSASGLLTAKKAGKAAITVQLKNDTGVSASLTAAVKAHLSTPKVHSVTVTSAHSLKILWNKVSGATSYNLYYKEGSAQKWALLQKGIKRTGYNHRGLKAGVTYTYTVRAVGKNVTSLYDKKGTSGTPVPTAPTSLKAASVSSSQNRITWKKTANADGYRVYVKRGSGWQLIGTTDAQTTSFVHKSSRRFAITPGKTYVYTVRAYMLSGKRQVNGLYNRSGVSVLSRLDRPTWGTAKTASRSITLRWKKCSGATGYVIYRYEHRKWVKKTVTRRLSYTEKVSGNWKYYKYRIRAYRQNGKNVLYSRSSSTLTVRR